MTRPDSFQAFLEGYGIDIVDFRFMCNDNGRIILDKAASGDISHDVRIAALFTFDENNFFPDASVWFRMSIAWSEHSNAFEDIPFFTPDDLYVDAKNIFYNEIRAKLILTFDEELL